MKYLKYFQEDSEYTEYKNSSNYVLPNVSYVVSTESIFFDPNLANEIVILEYGGYYPEVGAKLQEIWNKYGTKFGIDKSNHSINVAINPDDERIGAECCETDRWSYLDSEEELFFKSIRIYDLNFNYATFNNYSVQITCCDSDGSCNFRELTYDGHVFEAPNIT